MEHKRYCNFLSLVSIHGSNALVGLIAAPIALSQLGTDEYAKIAVTEAVTLFGVTAVIYSFDILGVKKVIDADNNHVRLAALLRNVVCAKLFIFTIVAIMVIIGYGIFAPDMLHYAMAWLLLPLSYALQPNWFCLGLERNFALGVITLASRVLLVLLLVLLIDSDSSGPIFIFIYASCFLLGAVVSLALIARSFPTQHLVLSVVDITFLFKEGYHVFLANFSVGLFRGSNVILMTMLGIDAVIISFYSIAEKIVKAVQVACRPINQYFMPQAFRVLSEFDRPSLQVIPCLFRTVAPQLLILSGLWVLCCTVLILTPLQSYLGIEDSDQLPSLAFGVSIMAVATFFGVANFIFGSVGLNSLGCKSQFFVAVATTGIATIVCSAFLVRIAPFYGAAAGFVFGEFLLFSLILLIYKKRGFQSD